MLAIVDSYTRAEIYIYIYIHSQRRDLFATIETKISSGTMRFDDTGQAAARARIIPLIDANGLMTARSGNENNAETRYHYILFRRGRFSANAAGDFQFRFAVSFSLKIVSRSRGERKSISDKREFSDDRFGEMTRWEMYGKAATGKRVRMCARTCVHYSRN